MSFSWGGAKCAETFSYSMCSILFPFRNHTDLFKTNVCACHRHLRLYIVCWLWELPASELLCQSGKYSDFMLGLWNMQQRLCSRYISIWLQQSFLSVLTVLFFFFFYYCWTRVFSKFCKWLRPNRLRSQFFHLVHFSDISHMHACVNVSISAFLYVYIVVVQAHMKFLLAKQK